jgi:two-component system, cell cycle sensor histidine kinase and response regulator CckA
VESERTRGTTFRIYLPAMGEEAPVKREARLVAASMPRGTETILLAEDEEPVRIMTQEFLESRGYLVLHAADGLEALGICEQYSDRIDLLITDIVMPRMGGRELAERVKRQHANVPVLYMSGYTDDLIVRHDEEHHFMAKPFTLQQLAEKVREVLETRKKGRGRGAHA